MFSGIIEHQAEILHREGGLFRVENKFLETELKIGQSIAHDGACMTITKYEKSYYEFFMMHESLDVTSFGTKKSGDTVNVERCLKLGDRIDGHIVSGHVDTVGQIILREKREDGSLILHISYPREYNNLIIRKGSITINGVSLTVVDDTLGSLSVSLIPLTQDWTNLGDIEVGESVNLEFDMFAKYMEKQRSNLLHSDSESI